MNKLKKILIGVVYITTLIVLVTVGIRVRETERIFLQEDRLAHPLNPSRGFYVQMDSQDTDRLLKYQGEVRLCLLAFDLYEFRDKEISPEKLQELEAFLQELKRHNMKCIMRVAYGFEREEVNDAESLDLVEIHVRQITKVINDYTDQIYCVQAGFFGPWGEWNSSIYLEDESEAIKNRNWLLGLLLNSYAEEIVIDVRRPRFLRDAMLAGLDMSRLGLHNDALLASESDMGTYDDESYARADELRWMTENILVECNGGEMPKVSEYTVSDNVIKEFSAMKLSYLNLKYNEEVYAQWQNEEIEEQNALSYIAKRLGYRYYVSEMSYPKNCYRDIRSIFQRLEVVIKNAGFAPIGERYVWEWVVEDVEGKKHIEEMEPPLISEKGQAYILEIQRLKDIEIKRIGIRVSERNDSEKKSCNCVEFVNQENVYEEGVNYLWEFDNWMKW